MRESRQRLGARGRGFGLCTGGARMRNLARLPLTILALVAVSCGQNPEDDISDDAALRDFRSCSELEDYIKAQALKDMNAQIDELIKGTFYDRGRGLPTVP